MQTEPIQDEREGLPSASAMPRIKACSPSLLRGAALPRVADDSTEDSRSGDRIHDALAKWLKSSLSADCELDPVKLPDFCEALSSEETTTAEIMAGQAARLVSEWRDGTEVTDLVIEDRIWICDHDGKKLASAKPDVVIVCAQRALCLDWKSGHNAVSHASENIQLRTLVLAVVYETGAATVRAGIVQSWSGKPHTCDYAEADIDQSFAEFQAILATAEAGEDFPAHPGVEQCRYCPAKEVCAERQQWLQGNLPATIRELPLSTHWGPVEWATFLDNEGAARKWLDERKAEAKRLLAMSPQSIPTHTLKEGTARSSIGSVDVVYSRYVAAGGTPQKFAAAAGISKKALGELLGEELKLKGKARDAKLAEIIDGCTKTGNTPEPTIERRAA